MVGIAFPEMVFPSNVIAEMCATRIARPIFHRGINNGGGMVADRALPIQNMGQLLIFHLYGFNSVLCQFRSGRSDKRDRLSGPKRFLGRQA